MEGQIDGWMKELNRKEWRQCSLTIPCCAEDFDSEWDASQPSSVFADGGIRVV